MKKIMFAAAPLLLAAALFVSPTSDPLPIGANLPHADKKMKNIDGKDISFKHCEIPGIFDPVLCSS